MWMKNCYIKAEQAASNDSDELCTMSSFPSGFNETNVMFLEYQPSTTLTPRRRAQPRLLKLERYVAANGRIPMSIAPGAENPILPHVVRFNQVIDVCVQKTFPVCCLKHFKKYSYLDEARANTPDILVGRNEDFHYLCDHYMSCAFQEQSQTNKATREKQPYNHSSGSKLFLQRQHELIKQRGEPVDRVELL
ncbi:CACTA en-spm transposon protein [Cucumis melo var. makuwa]|uniref:CACTA en-spm transposon protein n=1 Tax=Cucumis melo var. makuwa TaxID=1194695 RepID=A0A5A7V0I5_CUCMM|nr:CACTA en-spm transposon protein [Cucumis melo var. makuwa]